MIKYILTLFLVFTFFIAKSQVKLLTLDELNSRFSKGKDTTYVINFWATWCGPCVEEIPYFEKINIESVKKPVKVILVSLDFKSKLKNVVTPFVTKNKLMSEVYVINETDQQMFIDKIDKNWTGAIPATLFVNTQKKIKSFYQQPFATYKDLLDQLDSLKLYL